ncbi:MAG TPA: lysylphosphatidylglycerol synthase transmembrane domain-containing protein [Anaerolineales bacterium]|nr:lysylphosphatidylglycerol synthase transmembrane domain-containing protein [Anaerolineales bacterium]
MNQKEGVFSLRSGAILISLAGLLYFALRNAPLEQIRNSLRRLQFWQIVVILAIDLIIYIFTTARWWLIVQAANRAISYPAMIGVRISVFGISYFTIGPQVGGEPLQVIYLQRKYGLSYTRATSTVVMDKLLELLANFILLLFGLTGFVRVGLLSKNGSPPLAGLIGLSLLVAWPLIHILLLYRGIYPLSALLQAMPFHPSTKALRFLRACEHLAGRFCRRQTRALLAAVCVSMVAAAGMVSEYFLMTSFLHIRLPFWQTVAAWAAGWLSFLVPLPGGLGALEASQVFAMGFFGISAASAVGMALLMRARDLVIGGLGLFLAGRSLKQESRREK